MERFERVEITIEFDVPSGSKPSDCIVQPTPYPDDQKGWEMVEVGTVAWQSSRKHFVRTIVYQKPLEL
jgi:hypothetical protein